MKTLVITLLIFSSQLIWAQSERPTEDSTPPIRIFRANPSTLQTEFEIEGSEALNKYCGRGTMTILNKVSFDKHSGNLRVTGAEGIFHEPGLFGDDDLDYQVVSLGKGEGLPSDRVEMLETYLNLVDGLVEILNNPANGIEIVLYPDPEGSNWYWDGSLIFTDLTQDGNNLAFYNRNTASYYTLPHFLYYYNQFKLEGFTPRSAVDNAIISYYDSMINLMRNIKNETEGHRQELEVREERIEELQEECEQIRRQQTYEQGKHELQMLIQGQIIEDNERVMGERRAERASMLERVIDENRDAIPAALSNELNRRNYNENGILTPTRVR